MTTTTTKKPDAAKGREELSRLIESPSARAVLAGAGIRTLADAKAAGMERLVLIPDIGDGTLDVLRAAIAEVPAPAPTPAAEAKPKAKAPRGTEEGPHPLLLHSPHREYRFPLKKARRNYNATTGEHTDEVPLWVEFFDGHAKITSLMWFLRVHKGDEDLARADIAKGTPWRVACAEWLRSRNGHVRDFAIQGD